MRWRPFAVWGLLLALTGWSARAQTRTAWHRDPVLSRLLVQQMVTDGGGLRWVATDEGVFRYDGYETVALQRLVRRGPRLPVEMVAALTVDGAGRLWLGASTGLYCFEPARGTLRKVALAPDRQAGVGVSGLLWHARSNRLWVAHGLEVLVLDPARPARPLGKVVLPNHRNPSGVFTPERGSDEVWFSTYGHELYRLGADATVRGYALLPEFGVPLAGTRPQRLVTGQALLEAAGPGQWRTLLRWPGGREKRFQPCVTDSTFDFVMRGQRVRLRRPAGPRPQVRREVLRLGEDEPAAQTDYVLEQGRLGVWWCYSRVWRGCYKQRATGEVVQVLPLAGRRGPVSARAIRRLADGRLLVSTYAGLFAQAADSPQAPLRPLPLREWQGGPRPVPVNMTFLEMQPTAAGNAFVVAEEGLGFGVFNPASGVVDLLPGAVTTSRQTVLRDQAGRWWGGGQAGLYRLYPARDTSENYRAPPLAGRLRQLTVYKLAEDRPNRALWLATNGGLWWYRPADHRLRHFGAAAPAPYTLPTDALLTVLPAGAGRVWAGTRDQGLLEIDLHRGLRRQVSEPQGLPSHTVATLLAGPAGQLWLGTYAGIVRYDPARGQLAAFGAPEGMGNAELNRQSAFADADGSLWFGGLGGLCRIRPAPAPAGPAQVRPRLLATGAGQTRGGHLRESLLAGGALPRLTLAAEPGAMAEVQLAFTDYFAPELVRYSYRLRPAAGGPATAWQATPHRLVLRGLAPGTYDLEVRAENHLGQPAANRLRLPLRVLAVWWQLPAVWALAALLLVGLGYGLYGLRLRRLRREFSMRAELAANLHDEVGALLTRVNLLAEILREEHAPAGPVAEAALGDATFDRLLFNSRSAVQTMRDVVWGIDSRADSVGALLDRMRQHLEQTAAPARIRTRFRAEGLRDQLALHPALRQHLYLLFKEALTNVVRHGVGVTEVEVRLAYEGATGLVLEISDNGQDADLVSAQTPTGTGLRNMAQRAAAIGAVLYTGRRPDSQPGYCVRVLAPLRR